MNINVCKHRCFLYDWIFFLFAFTKLLCVFFIHSLCSVCLELNIFFPVCLVPWPTEWLAIQKYHRFIHLVSRFSFHHHHHYESLWTQAKLGTLNVTNLLGRERERDWKKTKIHRTVSYMKTNGPGHQTFSWRPIYWNTPVVVQDNFQSYN